MIPGTGPYFATGELCKDMTVCHKVSSGGTLDAGKDEDFACL
jgi:hypothetical protein